MFQNEAANSNQDRAMAPRTVRYSSPPNPTLSRTPTPLSVRFCHSVPTPSTPNILSPSQRGVTSVVSHTVTRNGNRPSPLHSISPARRGHTSRQIRGQTQGAGSSSKYIPIYIKYVTGRYLQMTIAKRAQWN